MKRLLLTLAAGAFGTLIALPMANAQSWEDMNNDASRIRQDNEGIHHDREEQREDIEQGRLVRVLADYDLPALPIHLVYLPDRRPTPKLRTFIDFVLERLGP